MAEHKLMWQTASLNAKNPPQMGQSVGVVTGSKVNHYKWLSVIFMVASVVAIIFFSSIIYESLYGNSAFFPFQVEKVVSTYPAACTKSFTGDLFEPPIVTINGGSGGAANNYRRYGIRVIDTTTGDVLSPVVWSSLWKMIRPGSASVSVSFSIPYHVLISACGGGSDDNVQTFKTIEVVKESGTLTSVTGAPEVQNVHSFLSIESVKLVQIKRDIHWVNPAVTVIDPITI